MKTFTQRIQWRKKILQLWRAYSWAVLGVLALLSLTLGYVGFDQQSSATDAGRTVLDNLYLALLLFTFNPAEGPRVGIQLEVARYLAILVASAALFKTLKVVFHEQYQALKIARVRDHVVICGLGEKGLLIAESYLKDQPDTKVVVVEANERNHSLATVRERGALICQGDASTEVILTKARVQHAKDLITVCGQDNINADIVGQTRVMLQKQSALPGAKPVRSSKLSCSVHLVDDNLRDLLEERFRTGTQDDACHLSFFNVHDSASRTLLIQHPVALAHETEPHLLVIGLGLLGQNFVERALKNWHESHDGHVPLHLTIIDPDATEKMKTLLHSKHIAVESCHLITHDLDVEDPSFQRAEWLHQPNDALPHPPPTVAYICLEEDNLSMTVALRLHREVALAPKRIIMCLRSNSGLPALLHSSPRSGSTTGKYSELKTFELLRGTCNADLARGGTTEVLARAIHEHYCLHEKARASQTNSDLPAQKEWGSLSESYREDNRNAAIFLGVKLSAIGCSIHPLTDDEVTPRFEFRDDEIALLARMEHDRWVAQKRQAGWHYGAVRNDNKKIHDHLQPWEDLTPQQQAGSRKREEDLSAILERA